MKRIHILPNGGAFRYHRTFYVEHLQAILNILAQGRDANGAQAVVRFRGLRKLAENSGNWHVRQFFAAFLSQDSEGELCLGRPRFLAAQSIVIGNLLAIVRSQDMELGEECRAAIGRLFSYKMFCEGNHYELERLKVKGNTGVVCYRLRVVTNKLKDDIGGCGVWCIWAFSYLLRHSDETKVRVCPYCNRSMLTVLSFTNNGDTEFRRSAIDHFLPESRYAWLGLSLCNLVPACDLCNSSIKNDEDILGRYLSREIGNPYEADFDSELRFTWGKKRGKALRCELQEEEVTVDTKNRRVVEVKESLGSYEFFKIKSLYEQNCAEEIARIPIKLYKAYSLEPGDTLRLLRRLPAGDVEASKEIVFSQSFDRDAINSSELAKITIDLVGELERC